MRLNSKKLECWRIVHIVAFLTSAFANNVIAASFTDPVYVKLETGLNVENNQVDPQFLQLCRKIMVANPMDLQKLPFGKTDPFAKGRKDLSLDEMKNFFSGRNAVVGRIEEDGAQRNVIVITGLGPKYTSAQREELKEVCNADIYDVIDVIEIDLNLPRDLLRDFIFALKNGGDINTVLCKYGKDSMRAILEIDVGKIDDIETWITSVSNAIKACLITMFDEQLDAIGQLGQKDKIRDKYPVARDFLTNLTISVSPDASKDLSGMYGNNVTTTTVADAAGRAVHSEVLYLKLCNTKDWTNLYFFTQRDMCPGCEARVQKWIKLLEGTTVEKVEPEKKPILVLSAINTHAQKNHMTGGVYISGANIELYSANNGWHLLNEENFDKILRSKRAMFLSPFDQKGSAKKNTEMNEEQKKQQQNVLKVRIPELAAHFDQSIKFYPYIVNVPASWQVVHNNNNSDFAVPIVAECTQYSEHINALNEFIARVKGTTQVSSEFKPCSTNTKSVSPTMPSQSWTGPSLHLQKLMTYAPTKKDADKDVPCGLSNIGNTCYLNATLQAMRACNVFRCTLIKSQASSFCDLLNSVFDDMKSAGKDLFQKVRDVALQLPVSSIKTALCGVFNHAGQRQQDAFELLNLLLDAASEEEKRCALSALNSDADFKVFSILCNDLLCGKKVEEDLRTLNLNSTDIENLLPFTKAIIGALETTTTCNDKSHTRITTDPIITLSLPIKECNTLQECLTAFLKKVDLDKWECPYCSQPKDASTYVNATKTYYFATLPPVLVIQFKRFEIDGRTATRLANRVSYEEKEIFKYKTGEKQYTLKAVIYHIPGNGKTDMESGHYTATVRVGNSWYTANDTTVAPAAYKVPFDEKSFENAYILIYEEEPSAA